ncbi:MAG: hypothetical protein K8I82_13955, partial [Anaerolineae bacterium]|nr:hypothetical protein [Anaerolineae bacterium]
MSLRKACFSLREKRRGRSALETPPLGAGRFIGEGIALIGRVNQEFSVGETLLYLMDAGGGLQPLSVPVNDLGEIISYDNKRVFLKKCVSGGCGVQVVDTESETLEDIIMPGQCIAGRPVVNASIRQ